MPTYAYRCRDCGHTLEVHQGFSDAALTECPVCGGVLRKQYGTVGVTFNGSGFYRTDSRAKDGSSGEQGGGASKSDGGSSDTTPKKADAPAAKTESAAPAKSAPSPAS